MTTRILTLTLSLLFALAPLALAATGSDATAGQPPTTGSDATAGQNPSHTGPNITLINPLGLGSCTSTGDCLFAFLDKILNFVIRIGAIVIVLMIVYIGYLFVAAQGKPDKLGEVRKALLWTLVGALILLGAKGISLGVAATVTALSVGQ